MQHASPHARLSAIAVAVIGALAIGNAAASGFQLRETSTKAGGRAYSGTAVAKDDTGTVSGNPAAMVNTKGTTVQAGVGVIDLTAGFTGSGTTALGTPISGGNGGNPGSVKAVPSLGVIVPMQGSLEGLTLGASITAPFGSSTEYEKGWVGRYNATETSVKIVDLTMSAAVQITPTFSAGVGLIYERAEVTLGKDIPLGTILAAGLQNPALAATPDGSIVVDGKHNGLGWVAGFQWRPSDRFALGYSHRSEIKHEFAGAADFTVPASFAAMQPGFVANATNPALPLTPAQRAQLMGLGRGFTDTTGHARLVTPAIDTLSASFAVTDRVTLYGEAQRTGWSSLRDVTIRFDNPYQPANTEQFRWKDTMFYSIGADFALNDAFTLRAGYGRDESPTNNIDRTPRLPDNDRNLYSVGMSWKAMDNLSVDASFTRVQLKDSTTNLPVNVAEGRYNSIKGTFTGHANVIGLGATYTF